MTATINDTTQTEAVQPPLTDQERNAMRAFLQRCEVRLSTLHRIATAFIGGAGLLLLLPVFFKDEVVTIIKIFLAHLTDTFPALGANHTLGITLLYVCLAYPVILSLSIPLYALYLLLKDIVHFYFTIYTPGFNPSLITPSFALGGLAFSPDESENVKRGVYEYQYHTSSINYTIPFSNEKRERYFEETIRNTDGKHPIQIDAVQYYDSAGQFIRNYLEQPMRLSPMASTAFVVDEDDSAGGVGANFIVAWSSEQQTTKPVVEAVMISAASTQGISFVSVGRVIESYPAGE